LRFTPLASATPVGDYVVVHVGFAIEKLRKEEADEIWKYPFQSF
jgi:hydrogenase maturation factor